MSWSVDIEPMQGTDLPPMSETVSSFCACPGNICTSIAELGYDKTLPHLPKHRQIDALREMILELNKGNDGKFTDVYCIECDVKWSGGKESQKQWDAWWAVMRHHPNIPDIWKTYESFTGSDTRRRLLVDAERFYLLLKAGYEVRFLW